MEIKRDFYIDKLMRKRQNGLIKVITGIRRCGKSFILDPLFKNRLLSEGVPADHIIKIELDRITNRRFYDDPEGFYEHVRSFIKDNESYFILLDEIQLVNGFESVLNGLLYEKNLDIYVTGSNSRFLSSDIITEFRGRGDQVHVLPLSFSEFLPIEKKNKTESWNDYLTFGGMPFAVLLEDETDKATYLKNLFVQTYYSDIIERNHIKRTDILDAIVSALASSVGSLTNAQKIYDTFKSRGEKNLSINTVNAYLSFLEDAFIVSKSVRYDIKGRKYISTPFKYYFSDLGLRNAALNFRQQEETHLMENAIYNELLFREYNVDVGVVETREKGTLIGTEVDFVCNKGSNRFYIQSALNLDTHEKTIRESRPLNNIRDSFKKIIIVKEDIKPWRTDDGILVLGVVDFMSDPDSLNK